MLLRRKSGIVSGGVILSVTIAAGLSGLPAPSAIAAVASSSTSGGGGVSVKEGARVTISGHVPAQFGSSTVVL